ncbi:hypothetical protein JB92DRAFT_3263685, partial [Gautieria morchelliformis]
GSLLPCVQNHLPPVPSLPQTRGASYVYSVHLHPLTAKQEVEIDAALGRIKERIWRWMMIRVGGLWITSGQCPREAMASGAGVRDHQSTARAS